MLSIEEVQKELTDIQLEEMVRETLKDFSQVKKVLLIHPDYTRIDFTDRLIPIIYRELKKKQMVQIDGLNAGGTHRKMTEAEIKAKLGLEDKESELVFDNLYNHQFDQPDQLVTVGQISADFVAEQTKNELNQSIPVVVNKLITDDYDLIITLSGTSPHESAGYAGGLKIFFPGISGPTVIDLLHWSAVLVGIPNIIGSMDNPARKVINKGSSYIFEAIKAPVVSFDMVFEEGRDNNIIPKGLYSGVGFDGFIEAYEAASRASSQIHIVYIKEPIEQAVQKMDLCYDEIWTAGKGSYKLQYPGVMAKGGEVIIYAPHIKCFHSQHEMEHSIKEIGYHCKEYVLQYVKKFPEFSRNVAAHVINVRGSGKYNQQTGEENCDFQVTLATGIPEDICQKVGLGYRDPATIRKEDFTSSKRIWIEHGGKYLYKLKNS
jgi:nickel-dependent lactate racemase